MLRCRARGAYFIPRLLMFAAAMGLLKPPHACAHEGPPFPILMDTPAAGHLVSVWADPDIGQAQFFVIIESPAGEPPREAPGVSVWVEPISGRLDRVTHRAKRKALRNQMQFEANPYFDQRDLWNVGIRLVTKGGRVDELVAQVESTPPGFGLWDLAIYLFPFVFLGGMWLFAMARRLGMQRPVQPDAGASPSPRIQPS